MEQLIPYLAGFIAIFAGLFGLYYKGKVSGKQAEQAKQTKVQSELLKDILDTDKKIKIKQRDRSKVYEKARSIIRATKSDNMRGK